MSAPYTFSRDGRIFICCYHPGHDAQHPDNATASHGICESCLRTWLHDENGRPIAPTPAPIADRPMGPWTQNRDSR